MVTTRTNLTTRRHKGRQGQSPNLIGMHTVEGPEVPNLAENVANYFKTVNASSHWACDNDSRVRIVNDEDTSWTLPGAANRSLNIEMAGFARQSAADWADGYSIAMLDIAALCVAEWSKKYNIPIRKLTDDQIRNHSKGLAGHVDVNRVYRKSTHWDPGPNFPWKYFLGRCEAKLAELNGSTAKPSTPRPTPTWDNHGHNQTWIKRQQAAANKLGAKLDEDGRLGPLSKAWFSSFQKKNGLTIDGIPGPATAAKLASAISAVTKPGNPPVLAPPAPTAAKKDFKRLQKAVRADEDNIWGADTEKRFNALREASAWGGHDFPHGKEFAQSVVGTPKDGSWGKNSVKAHDHTVAQVQKALLLLGFNPGGIDGRWGSGTEKAYQAARKTFRG